MCPAVIRDVDNNVDNQEVIGSEGSLIGTCVARLLEIRK